MMSSQWLKTFKKLFLRARKILKVKKRDNEKRHKSEFLWISGRTKTFYDKTNRGT